MFMNMYVVTPMQQPPCRMCSCIMPDHEQHSFSSLSLCRGCELVQGPTSRCTLEAELVGLQPAALAGAPRLRRCRRPTTCGTSCAMPGCGAPYPASPLPACPKISTEGWKKRQSSSISRLRLTINGVWSRSYL